MIARLIAGFQLLLAAVWHPLGPGIWLREERFAAAGPLAHVNAIVVRVDLSRNRLTLDLKRSHQDLQPEWGVDSMPPDAVVAVNAGQFTGGFPWGWLVRDGKELKPPGKGALGMALVIDSAGKVALVMPDEVPSQRGRVIHAFQSYPALVVDGETPWELRASGRGVDLEHRDSRLAVCTLDDGSLVIVLTRFAALGAAGSTFPWGPTVPEMADYMLSLGCVRSMLLDGGISSQLAVRSSNGKLRSWSNWRRVPLAMIVTPLR
ncbi:MAG TPA: phosphodiester glycosidase family protein [Gemmatimonadaceae bacterium]|nr:phosphodiester glycosidase family protein [Gemmatimonadaceae bacterium]